MLRYIYPNDVSLRAMIIIKTILALMLLIISVFPAYSCEIIMGYRTSVKLPYIEQAPNNQGLYFSLYKKALADIGCSLAVVRAPKKRILKMLAEGEIDFYPGLGYSPEREQYLHFLKNGLVSNTVIISHQDSSDVTQLSDMEGKILLMSIGANTLGVDTFNIAIRHAYDITISSVIKLLEQKRVDYYIYNEDAMRYHLKINPNENIKIHPCCFPSEPMHFGFSKRSKYASAHKNDDFNSAIEGSTKNLKEHLNKDTKAYQFKQMLHQMKRSGETVALKEQYF